MSDVLWLARWLVVGGVLWLTGCSHQPAAPPADTGLPVERSYSNSLEQRRQLARQLQASGDLAAAAAQWQILTLIAPNDDAFRRELAGARAAISKASGESYQTGLAAWKRGEGDEASKAMLRTLALDPSHAEAAQVLRDIEKQKISRVQAGRAARVRREEEAAASNPPPSSVRPPEPHQTYDVEQPLAMFLAGDTDGGLRELRRYVEANPGDRTGRQRIASVVYEQARKVEGQGAREQALGLYQQAVSLRGDAPAIWDTRIKALRKTLAGEYYEKGLRVYRSDIAAAIRYWEAGLRFDPDHVNAALRLREARLNQEKLKRIDDEKARR